MQGDGVRCRLYNRQQLTTFSRCNKRRRRASSAQIPCGRLLQLVGWCRLLVIRTKCCDMAHLHWHQSSVRLGAGDWTGVINSFIASNLHHAFHSESVVYSYSWVYSLRSTLSVHCMCRTHKKQTRRSAIADKPRCSVSKLWQKYKCEKCASNIALSYGAKDISTCWTV